MRYNKFPYFNLLFTNSSEETLFLEESLVLPEQLYAPDKVLTVERALMIAVFENALVDYFRQGDSRREKRLRRESEAWLQNSDHEWLFSFETICSYLDLNPNAVRKALPEMQERVTIRDGRKVFVRQGMIFHIKMLHAA